MPDPSLTDGEAARLASLERYRILDTASEAEYDDITSLASFICATPIALISFIDAERQWFKSRIGIDAQETSRSLAFCAHAIAETRTFVVPDAPNDPRFATNPLVTSDPGIRFYAGAPLRTNDGFNLGTLCVLDRTPRQLSPEQQHALEALSRQVVRLLELRHQKLIFAALVENSPAATYLRDPNGEQVYANSRWRAAPFSSAADPGGPDALAHDDGSSTETLHHVPAPDGSEQRWLALRFPIDDVRGRRLIGGIAVDVTRALHAEEQLERVRRVESLGRLASFVAHEFNNVLMGIGTLAAVLRKRSTDATTSKALDSIAAAVERGKRVTQQILDYGKPVVVKRRSTDLCQWLTDLTPELRAVLPARIDLQVTLPDRTLMVSADPQRLSQVVTNLVANARDAVIGEGSITITLRSINEADVAVPPLARLSVRDTGSGMTAETQRQVFEPLFTTKSTGNGFGLAIAQEVVRQHDGIITVESTVGSGTTFHVNIPLAQASGQRVSDAS